MKPIDITMSLRQAHYPADPAIALETVLDVENGAMVNMKRYSFGSHSGTHVDPQDSDGAQIRAMQEKNE